MTYEADVPCGPVQRDGFNLIKFLFVDLHL
jgi:hypothetical protein